MRHALCGCLCNCIEGMLHCVITFSFCALVIFKGISGFELRDTIGGRVYHLLCSSFEKEPHFLRIPSRYSCGFALSQNKI